MTGWARGPVDELPEERRTGRLRTFSRRTSKTVISLLSVAVLTAAWYGWYFVGDINSGTATTDVFDAEPSAVPLDGAVDILMVGLDSRTDAHGNPLPDHVLAKLHLGENEGQRLTDTMILVHIPQDGSRAVAISFPRDAWVEFAGGYGEHKLNSAYSYAYHDVRQTLQEQGVTDPAELEEEAKVAGRKNLIATVEKLIGKPGMIDRYAEVNLASFWEVTNAIGGVEVCLNKAVQEASSGARFKAGKQTVKGKQALAFVRQRYGLPNQDLDRIARQQAFLSGLTRKLLSPDLLMDPSRISDVVKAVQKSVVLSAGWNLTEFAAQMRGLNGSQVEFHTVPTLGNTWIGPASVVALDLEEVRQFVGELTADDGSTPSSPAPPAGSPLPGAESVTIDVFNGSGDATLGNEVRTLLRNKGFLGDSVFTLDIRYDSVIRYAPGDDQTVDLVREAFGAAGLDVGAEPDPDVAPGTVRLLLGTDFQEIDLEPTETSQPSSPPEAGTTSAEPSDASQHDDGQTRNDSGESADGEGRAGKAPITAGDIPCVN